MRFLDFLRYELPWWFRPYTCFVTLRQDRLAEFDDEVEAWLEEHAPSGYRWMGTTVPTEEQREGARRDRGAGKLHPAPIFWHGLAFKNETEMVLFRLEWGEQFGEMGAREYD